MSDTRAISRVESSSSWYRRLYLRVEAMSTTPYALATMLVVSVVDGSVFPVPPFVVLIPMVVAEPRKWWRLALWGTLASLAGGAIGYYLGTLMHAGLTHVGIDLSMRVNAFGIHKTVGQLLGDNVWVLALLCSVLPTPFKVVAIGAGFAQVAFARFFLAAIIGRLARFFVVAGVVRGFGPSARRWLAV